MQSSNTSKPLLEKLPFNIIFLLLVSSLEQSRISASVSHMDAFCKGSRFSASNEALNKKRSKKIKKRSKEENHLTTEFDFIKTHTAITTTKPLLEKLPLIFFLVPFKYLSDKVSILCSVAVFCHCLLLGSVCADLHV